MRKIEIDLRDILDLVNCAHDYGFSDNVLMSSFAEFTGPVSEAEIEEFARYFLTPAARREGYGQEDVGQAKERLTEWADKYCRPSHERK